MVNNEIFMDFFQYFIMLHYATENRFVIQWRIQESLDEVAPNPRWER